MKSTTIEIPDELDDRLHRAAEQRGISVPELVVEVLKQHLSEHPRLFHIEGIGFSGQGDLSERVEEILAEEWEQDIDPGGHRPARRSR